MISETYNIGKSINPADNLTKVGKKTLNQEAEVRKYFLPIYFDSYYNYLISKFLISNF